MEPHSLSETLAALSARDYRALPHEPVEALYVHVPFCVQKCSYCDFYSEPGLSMRTMSSFVDAIAHEATAWKEFLERTNSRIRSVFIGGGTPTALPPALMAQLLSGLQRLLPISGDAEFTVEANPATVDCGYCEVLLQHGVNRLSIGAQSMVDTELRELGRIHSAQQVRDTVRAARGAGFQRISLDLIYSLPRQTLDSWRYSLEQALSLGIHHVSCYCLIVEAGTPLWQQVQRGTVARPSEEQERQFMALTRNWLTDRGLPPYEISNYATPGDECRHNLVYWRSGNYLGLGPAAASHIGGTRWRNVPATGTFLASAAPNQPAAVTDVEMLAPTQRATELVMLALRTQDGLSWRRLAEVAGPRLKEELEKTSLSKMTSLGLVSVCSEGVKLTEQGSYVADQVVGELIRGLD